MTVSAAVSGEADVAAALPPPPTLRGALRSALADFYYNSWRLVPANVLWGLGLITLYVVFVFWPVGTLLLSPLLAIPTVGMYRMAALIVRGESVSFWDGIGAWRQFLVPALGAGTVSVVATTVFSVNLVGGLASADVIGWAFATLAVWGLIATGLLAVVFWPILVDPRREGWGVRRALRLAAYLILAHPVRFAALAVSTALLLALSTVAFAALVTISVALAALFGAHFVLPAADRLEAKLGVRGVVFGPVVSPGTIMPR